jgi:putative transcription antitermination factor YqgF
MTAYLGIDYGKKHLGIAVADGPLARPLITIDSEPAQTITAIVKIVEQENIATIVVGLPGGGMDREIRKYAEKLAKCTGKEVVFHNETLSSYEAIAGLRASNASRSKKKKDHQYAACLILEDYLEAHNIVH